MARAQPMQTLFGGRFEAALRHSPACVAMTVGAATLSYGALERHARDLSARLRGVLPDAPPGCPVALLCPCPLTNLIGFLAVQHAGFAHVPVNPRLTEPELAQLLMTTGARLLLSEEPRAVPEGVTSARVIAARGAVLPVFDLPAAPDSATWTPAPEDSIGLIISSSGSGGHPKCVRVARGRYAHHIAAQASACDVRSGDIFQLVLPLFHGGGLIGVLGAGMAAGATIAAMQPGPFVAEHVLDHLDATGATLTHWIPTMLFRVATELETQPRRLDRLRLIYFGSMPMDPALMERCRGLFPGKLCQTYGSTECGLIGTLSPAEIDAGIDASACILPGQGVRVIDEAGYDVAEGETGELVVARDVALISDYARDPELTARVVRGDLVHSGDLVRLGSGGHFRFVGRKDAMIVSGGFKVAPSEVEASLARHPDIVEIAVIGTPDPEFGQVVCAVIRPRAHTCPPLEELRCWAARQLAPYKLPRRVVCLPALPRTETGKIAYGQLNAILASTQAPAV